MVALQYRSYPLQYGVPECLCSDAVSTLNGQHAFSMLSTDKTKDRNPQMTVKGIGRLVRRAAGCGGPYKY